MEAGIKDREGVDDSDFAVENAVKKKLPVEVYFLRYAFPCAFVIKEKNEISQQEYDDLERAAVEGFTVAKPILERIFHRAFYHISNLSKNMEKDKWDYEVIEEYFTNYHNHIIEMGEGAYATAPEKMKELSKVKQGRIIGRRNDILKITFNGSGEIRAVLNHFVPDAKIGEKVRVHYGYAVEVV